MGEKGTEFLSKSDNGTRHLPHMEDVGLLLLWIGFSIVGRRDSPMRPVKSIKMNEILIWLQGAIFGS
jgi:hypothetical protein